MEDVEIRQERVAVELEKWANDKLFTLPEVRLIAKKRTNFEYITAARNTDLVDFLRYIKFETDLDRLYQTRLKKARKKRDFVHGIKTIGRIYEKATHRFTDKNLFILYINFCLERRAFTSVKHAFSRGVRTFPTEPDIWIMASNFEYDINKNVTAARVLLQMALRYNKESEKLWTAFFTLELKYWRKMSKRAANDNSKPLKANTENAVELDENDESAGSSKFAAAGDPANHTSASGTSNPFLECAVPQLLYKTAVKAAPNSYQFRAKFLGIARKFQKTEPLIDMISQNIVETFPLNEQALSTHADLQFRELGKFNTKSYERACAVYEHIISANTKSSSIWGFYITYLREKLAALSLNHVEPVQYLTSKLLDICEKAPISPSTYLVWIEILVSTGNAEQAHKIANRSVKKFPTAAALRLQKIELLIKSGQPKEKILATFERSVKKAEGSAELWYRYIQWMTLNGIFDTSNMLTEDSMETELGTTQADKAVVSIAARCLKSVFASLSPEDFNLLKINLFNTIFFHFGITAARAFLEQALKAPPTTLSFCVQTLAIEEAQRKDEFSAQVVRQLYETAVRTYGESAECEDIWLRYIKFEQSQLQITKAGDLYWRAKKALKDATSFMAKYDQIKQN